MGYYMSSIGGTQQTGLRVWLLEQFNRRINKTVGVASEHTLARVLFYRRIEMEADRVLAKTLIGLRNIAWAAYITDKPSKHAKFMYTMLALAVKDPEHISIIRLALLMSPMDIPA